MSYMEKWIFYGMSILNIYLLNRTIRENLIANDIMYEHDIYIRLLKYKHSIKLANRIALYEASLNEQQRLLNDHIQMIEPLLANESDEMSDEADDVERYNSFERSHFWWTKLIFYSRQWKQRRRGNEYAVKMYWIYFFHISLFSKNVITDKYKL